VLTVNKAQGQTLNRVGLDLSPQAFAHGQLFVALSRVRNQSALSYLMVGDDLIPSSDPAAPRVDLAQSIIELGFLRHAGVPEERSAMASSQTISWRTCTATRRTSSSTTW